MVLGSRMVSSPIGNSDLLVPVMFIDTPEFCPSTTAPFWENVPLLSG